MRCWNVVSPVQLYNMDWFFIELLSIRFDLLLFLFLGEKDLRNSFEMNDSISHWGKLIVMVWKVSDWNEQQHNERSAQPSQCIFQNGKTIQYLKCGEGGKFLCVCVWVFWNVHFDESFGFLWKCLIFTKKIKNNWVINYRWSDLYLTRGTYRHTHMNIEIPNVWLALKYSLVLLSSLNHFVVWCVICSKNRKECCP